MSSRNWRRCRREVMEASEGKVLCMEVIPKEAASMSVGYTHINSSH
jgi:hypothetical protein